jgi:hypothetical protein
MQLEPASRSDAIRLIVNAEAIGRGLSNEDRAVLSMAFISAGLAMDAQAAAWRFHGLPSQ